MPKFSFTGVIIEDSRAELVLLKELLKEFNEISIVGTADRVSSGINIITNYKPDVIFLDVQLFDQTGFEVVEKIKEYNIHPLIVFTTSHSDFAIEAIKNNAFDYLLKPIDLKTLSKTMDKIKNKLLTNYTSSNNCRDNILTKIGIPDYGRTHFVDLNQIVFLETVKGEGFTVFNLLNGNKITATKGIGEFDKELLYQKFEKLNRSFTINPEHIKIINRGGKIEFTNNMDITISARVIKELLKKLNM
jgi:two-component system, LytTR family, response regulator